MPYSPLELYVWGSFACFTRPEMKVERVSYEVMTPSAARGVLEAIFWKPEFQWIIQEIRVLKPIRHFSLLRNEVNSRVSYAASQRRQRGGDGYFVEEDRSQRHTLCLRDVAYTIVAYIALRPGIEDDEAKYRDQFHRRARRGQCYHTPYLGCRECAAYFGLEPPDGLSTQPQNINVKLGQMLFDIEYDVDQQGRGRPHFFPAELRRGVLAIPERLYRLHRLPKADEG